MIKHIVVAVDSSPTSDNALDMAINLAKTYDAKLSFLHVIRDMQLPESVLRMAEVEHIQGARTDVLRFVGEKILKSAEKKAKDAGLNNTASKVAVGDPASEITDLAKKDKADLIVIGTRGHSDLKGMFLGSVSRKVSNLAGVNVMIVR
ncbi:MAG: universal stress protein [Rhodospirillaceae bacterium]|jgi:nucleotide-binding universal stress UspA family protein|nr:universal stress protein [Rhodospirillaceae bacterium]MBT5244545.1 universal stress protein [Rhodospirillaceae bacterium]MBT5562859.1 universal stress protein [Rhodospirillaceae bacterium]MBT6242501.1 universal stress protein [Rhodospirillaceae bacterium]MBT7137957.1 universal stress protein [Rhodospirillaceae bacterium]